MENQIVDSKKFPRKLIKATLYIYVIVLIGIAFILFDLKLPLYSTRIINGQITDITQDSVTIVTEKVYSRLTIDKIELRSLNNNILIKSTQLNILKNGQIAFKHKNDTNYLKRGGNVILHLVIEEQSQSIIHKILRVKK
jgi:hypothetical protein